MPEVSLADDLALVRNAIAERYYNYFLISPEVWAACRRIAAECERLQKTLANECRDWAEDHTHLQDLCCKAGIDETKVLGDGYMPWIQDLGDMLAAECERLQGERDRLVDSIKVHHAQKADDRCWMDDDRIYSAAGLPPADTRVGDKDAMLENCKRFLESRCKGGGWKTYAELERERDTLKSRLRDIHKYRCDGENCALDGGPECEEYFFGRQLRSQLAAPATDLTPEFHKAADIEAETPIAVGVRALATPDREGARE